MSKSQNRTYASSSCWDKYFNLANVANLSAALRVFVKSPLLCCNNSLSSWSSWQALNVRRAATRCDSVAFVSTTSSTFLSIISGGMSFRFLGMIRWLRAHISSVWRPLMERNCMTWTSYRAAMLVIVSVPATRCLKKLFSCCMFMHAVHVHAVYKPSEMGNQVTSINYGTALPGSGDGENTATIRNPRFADKLLMNFPNNPVAGCWDIFLRGCGINPDGPMIGTREKLDDGSLGRYKWRSYLTCKNLAVQLGSGILNEALCPPKVFPDELAEGAREMRMVGVFSKNREEWLLLELAANAFGLTLVPLYETLGNEALEYILDRTGIEVCVLGGECVDSLIGALTSKTEMKSVVLLDTATSKQTETLKEKCIRMLQWDDVMTSGRKNPRAVSPGTMKTVNTICFTSGTTGVPKGALITHASFVAAVSAALTGQMSDGAGMMVTNSDVHLSYLPMPHIFERLFLMLFYACGCRIGFYGGDTLKLLDDVRLLKPTIFISVPRLFSRINDKIFSGIADKSSVAQFLFRSGMASKMASMEENTNPNHRFWDMLVFNKTKALLGGRVRLLVSGGAPLDPVVQKRMCALFCCQMVEGFGMTETMGGSSVTLPEDPVKGHVGGPVPSMEYRLRSVPEMNYLVSQKPPRGELLIRGNSVFAGYFKNPEQTHATVDSEGWLHTGDIAALMPNNSFKIVDRMKSIFKLSQGEYVAPEKIEGAYQQAPLVAQAFVHGDSNQAFAVAVLIPDEEASTKWWKNKMNTKVPDSIVRSCCENPDFLKDVITQLDEISVAAHIKGFERAKEISLHHEPFSVANGLLTPTFKLRRHQAKIQFAEDIEAMYARRVS
eukprot:GHVO01032513.1.p1 GENE.GHVO01032513.1~~GHVO01032513.1.p1  ORF type:complete len:836 (+),score=159.96 GHVO01032513.1:362-2869(+)